MMNDNMKSALEYMLTTMWENHVAKSDYDRIIERKGGRSNARYEESMSNWYEGRIGGIHHAMFCLNLTGALKAEGK